MSLRLDPELMDWVQTHPQASTWVREILRALRAGKSLTGADRETFHRRIQKVVSAAIKEVKATHGDVAQHAGSVGKRVASQLWADMALPETEKKPGGAE